MSQIINVIDLFAGPGGLGEGFSAFTPSGVAARSGGFRIRMSVEKEASAHKTLSLRALYRKLKGTSESSLYHDYLEGHFDRGALLSKVPEQWQGVLQETLGGPKALGEDNEIIHHRLRELVRGRVGQPWVVIGGPPCQAYSLAGRSRNKGIKDYRPEEDGRHFLYQEYLEVLSIVQPEVFVMENVKGILTSKVGGERIFPVITKDLSDPSKAIGKKRPGKQYQIYSFVLPPSGDHLFPLYKNDSDFVIRTEDFGVPQARHRVILLGVSKDIGNAPGTLGTQALVPVEHVLSGLPKLRSKLSKAEDSPVAWEQAIKRYAGRAVRELGRKGNKADLISHLEHKLKTLKVDCPTQSSYRAPKPFSSKLPVRLRSWLDDDAPVVTLNHDARKHMDSDLGRYFFSACWAETYTQGVNSIPKAADFPVCLAPAHANWNSGDFADRFRVQRRGRPATTITSHISKDGHYFIHYDSSQCRALTVREAARIQTFPDNYLFEGNRTEQYVQVGNAVPPFLARQLAEIVFDLLNRS